MGKQLPLELRHLPGTVRKRIGRALGVADPEEERHKVFVYGTLLTGEHNAARAGRDARRQPAWTTGTLFDTGHGFPAFVRNGDRRIEGELLEVSQAGLFSMDCLEGCPHLYRREEIEVFPTRGGRTRAWVYIMNRLPAGATEIESGDWRERGRARR